MDKLWKWWHCIPIARRRTPCPHCCCFLAISTTALLSPTNRSVLPRGWNWLVSLASIVHPSSSFLLGNPPPRPPSSTKGYWTLGWGHWPNLDRWVTEFALRSLTTKIMLLTISLYWLPNKYHISLNWMLSCTVQLRIQKEFREGTLLHREAASQQMPNP